MEFIHFKTSSTPLEIHALTHALKEQLCEKVILLGEVRLFIFLQSYLCEVVVPSELEMATFLHQVQTF